MALEMTGERYIPQMGALIAFEHIARYIFASNFVYGKKVLDIPSGEGYGTYELSKKARSITGIDISVEAVEHAKRKYVSPNLNFEVASLELLTMFQDNEFDVITCFEGIEHVGRDIQIKALKELRRVLKDDGILIISSPNKLTYSDLANYQNPYHFAEYYYKEMKSDLESNFPVVKFLGQFNLNTSLLLDLENNQAPDLYKINSEGRELDINIEDALYFIAVCSMKPIILPPVGVLDIKNEIAKEINHKEYEFKKEIEVYQLELSRKEREKLELENILNQIYKSRSWKLASFIGKLWRLKG